MRVGIRTTAAMVGLILGASVQAQKLPADQWPGYQNNSNFSPLTQITPANVSKLTEAWTFHYGAGCNGKNSD